MSYDYDPYDTYLSDTFTEYEHLLSGLTETGSVEDFRRKLLEINEFMASNPSAFGKGSGFINPDLLSNLEAVGGIQKVLQNQKKDGRNNLIYFLLGLGVSLILFAIDGYFLK